MPSDNRIMPPSPKQKRWWQCHIFRKLRCCQIDPTEDLYDEEHTMISYKGCHETSPSIVTTTPGPWSNAPNDIISSIANRLSLIDFVNLRAVCKSWYSIPTSSAEIRSHGPPWLLLCNDGTTHCMLYDMMNEIKYQINLPELHETICLASSKGWLLLSRGSSVFFFCPFSRSKIKLPEFTSAELVDHVGAFSSLPTCQDCVVTVVKHCDNGHVLEINVIRSGENSWTRHMHNHYEEGTSTIKCATYCNRVLYFVDKLKSELITFLTIDEWITPFQLVCMNNRGVKECIPFVPRGDSFLNNEIKRGLRLQPDVAVSTCGMTMIVDEKSYAFVCNKNMKAVSQGSACYVKGIWIQPRSHQISPTQDWTV